MKRTLDMRNLLAFVGVVATALGTMRVGTDLMAKAVVTCLVLAFLGGLAGALIRRTGAWIGFAAFAWGYLIVMFFVDGLTPEDDIDLTRVAIAALADGFHDHDLPEVPVPAVNKDFVSNYQRWKQLGRHALTIGYDPSDPEAIDTSRLKPAELEQMKQYERECFARDGRSQQIRDRNRNARFLGLVWMAIVFGVVGSIFGQFLGRDTRPRRPEGDPSPI